MYCYTHKAPITPSTQNIQINHFAYWQWMTRMLTDYRYHNYSWDSHSYNNDTMYVDSYNNTSTPYLMIISSTKSTKKHLVVTS